MEDDTRAIATLHELRDLGIKLSIDDFGSGYSSLSRLEHLPINVLKIDQSFVHDMMKNPKNAAIMTAIITLGHNLDLKVVAEGVEMEEQARLLRLLKCDHLQGYLFSRPLPVEAFARLMSEKFCLP
jgi:EAL domain-containing protein (putative c-di-GMP-specific phosphodiesterase class I)